MDIKVAILAVVAVIVGAGLAIGAIIVVENFNDDETVFRIEVGGDSGVDSTTGGGVYIVNGDVTVKASVKNGYYLDGWYDGDGNYLSSSNPYTFKAEKKIFVAARTLHVGSVKVYQMDGIDHVEKMSYKKMDGKTDYTAYVKDGYTFKGWYDLGGTLLSEKETIAIFEKDQGNIVAKTTSTKYDGTGALNATPEKNVRSTSTTWVVTDWRTGDFVNSITGTSSLNMTVIPGKYDVRLIAMTADSENIDVTTHNIVNGKVNVYHEWKFEGITYNAQWTAEYKDYEYYQNLNVNRSPQKYSDRVDFLKDAASTTGPFADYLKSKSTSMTKLQRAQFVLAFVQQCIDYQYDSDFCYKSDYWKYPYETLFDQRGDCEDSTILYAALMKSMGYDSAMLLYVGEEYVGRGHAAAGVVIDSVPGGSYYTYESKNYYYCETTGTGWMVGQKVGGYSTAYVITF